jgi:hypothetical protein
MGSPPRLPPEILHKIFPLACIDGGLTACTLRQVSHSFHQNVAPYRYRTVAVRGMRHLVDLVALLVDCTEQDRRIEHLYVSIRRPNPLTHDQETDDIQYNILDALIQRIRPNLQRQEHTSPFDTLFALLCTLCMRTLRSLSVLYDSAHSSCYGSWDWALFSFPVLRRLSVSHELSLDGHARVQSLSDLPLSSDIAPCLHTVHVGFSDFYQAHPLLRDFADTFAIRPHGGLGFPLLIIEGQPSIGILDLKDCLDIAYGRLCMGTNMPAHLRLIGVNVDSTNSRGRNAWRIAQHMVYPFMEGEDDPVVNIASVTC